LDYQPPQPSEQLVELLIELFVMFRTNFGGKHKFEQWDDERLMMWAVTLTELSITLIEFKLAASKARQQDWQPSSPKDFLNLGRQAIEDRYPDSYTAYIAAANRNYLHPVCHETAKRIGINRLANELELATKKLWFDTYRKVCIEHSQDSTKFNQNIAVIEQKQKNNKRVLEAPKISLEEQSAITMAAIKKFRELQ
jgi:hypothetical protein